MEQSALHEDSVQKEETPLKNPTDYGTTFIFELKWNIGFKRHIGRKVEPRIWAVI